VAILREQGVNSHIETAYVMHQAGFTAVDVHMSDLIAGRAKLDDFQGIIAVGGFSYGDVLGAGEGWAKTILFNAALSEQFARFFARTDSFGLGVCNGCQMMSNLKPSSLARTPGPSSPRNKSEKFEARFAMVEVLDSPSIFFNGMAGTQTPIAIAHGEGYADFSQTGNIRRRGSDAFRRQPRRRHRSLSVQPERLAARPDFGDHGRRPLHRDDAARRARVPHGAAIVASGIVGRGFAVDAHVPQRAQVRTAWGNNPLMPSQWLFE
jgi:phosphoribosylformylglycinamidine (FGAM) synthase-like amidotransferase family enzyme